MIRQKDGHTLASLGVAAGLSKPYLSQLETGEREPNASVTRTLAVALNVPISVLDKRDGGSIYTEDELIEVVDVARQGDDEDDEVVGFADDLADEVPA